MPSPRLVANWVSTLQAARWTIDKKASTFGALEVKRHGYLIIVNTGGVTICDRTIVNVR